MSQALLAKAKAYKELYAKKAAVEGSGYHADDRPWVAGNKLEKSPRRPDGREVGQPTLDQDFMLFDDRFYCHLYGEQAIKAESLLKDLYDNRATALVYGVDPAVAKAATMYPDVKLDKCTDGTDRLTIHLGQKNDFLKAMELSGVTCSETSVRD
jgi:hypothetical protein